MASEPRAPPGQPDHHLTPKETSISTCKGYVAPGKAGAEGQASGVLPPHARSPRTRNTRPPGTLHF